MTALLLALCLWPKTWMPVREAAPRGLSHADKLVHFGLFAVFGAAWVSALSRSQTSRAVLLGVGIVLAAGTEWLQGLPVIARDLDVLDALADLVGVTTAVAVAAVFWPAVKVRPTERAPS